MLAYAGRGAFVQRLEHLTCFVAGNLALGVHTGAVNGTKAGKYMALARNLTNTCYEMYRSMPTGASQSSHNMPQLHVGRPCIVHFIMLLCRALDSGKGLDLSWQHEKLVLTVPQPSLAFLCMSALSVAPS